MFFGLGGRAHDSQNQLFLTLETPNDSTKSKKRSRMISEKYEFGNSQNQTWSSKNLKILEGGESWQIPKIHLRCFENLEYGIHIYPKT